MAYCSFHLHQYEVYYAFHKVIDYLYYRFINSTINILCLFYY